MALDIEHRSDRAILTFTGEVTVHAAMELVGLIDGLLSTYFYPRIDLVLASHGGVVAAANPYFAALDRWRARGTVLRTSVFGNASSLAAVMFAVADERFADPHARLLFHSSRVSEATQITAQDAVSMHGLLSHLDARLVELLVDRALRGGSVVVPSDVREGDDLIVAALLRDLAIKGRSRTERARARSLAGFVNRALHRRDRESLDRLYRAVLRRGAAMSSHLACLLCLADRVVEPESPVFVVREPLAPGLLVPEWRSLYPPRGEVPRAACTRHLLALGETGSGKTLSVVLPIVAALARAPRDQVSGVLVIDPKGEISPLLSGLAGDDLHQLRPGAFVLDLMDSDRCRLDEDLAERRWATAAAKIMLRMRGFAPASPLRVLGPHAPQTSNSEFFDREGCALFRDVLAFVLMLIDRRAPSISKWLPAPPSPSEESDADACFESPGSGASTATEGTELPEPGNPRVWVETLSSKACGSDEARGLNVVALGAWCLGSGLVQLREEDDHGEWLWKELADAARPAFDSNSEEARDLLERISRYWFKAAVVRGQHMGVLASARGVVHEFAAPAAERTLFFGFEPGLVEAGRDARVDFARFVACEVSDRPPPRFIVYQPSRDPGDSLVAASLKALFFESLFADEVRQSCRPDLPLIGYAADEAHRFVSSDAIHGEQSFLDACRSFGCLAILATQALASIEFALSQGSGGDLERRASMEVVLANTGTKLLLRTSCSRAAEVVDDLVPRRPGYAPVTRVRPLSALPVGSCYAFLPDGSFQIAQLDPFDPGAPSLGPRTSEPLEMSGSVESSVRSRRRRRRRRRRPAPGSGDLS